MFCTESVMHCHMVLEIKEIVNKFLKFSAVTKLNHLLAF